MTVPRSVRVLGLSIFVLGLGEELWQAYLPAYMAALGAGGVAIGLFSSSKDLLDSLYQYPGGWLADRAGRRAALLTFTTIAAAGYIVYAAAPSWPVMFLGLLGVMAWKAGAFPVTFAVIADAFPAGRRGLAFSLQSILVRVPRVIGAPLGGLLIAALGLSLGFRTAMAATIVMAAGVLAVQFASYPRSSASEPGGAGRVEGKTLPAPLVRLLAAECLVRIGEAIAAPFIVLFVLQDLGTSPDRYGLLYALQQGIAIASYLPGGRIADAAGRPPIVVLTMVFFALFPLSVRLAPDTGALMFAFVVGGFKEIGEPARKSLIVDLAPAERTARTVGWYYTIRNLTIVPGGVIGGALWQRAHHLPLEVAFAVSLTGAALFALTSWSQRHEGFTEVR